MGEDGIPAIRSRSHGRRPVPWIAALCLLGAGCAVEERQPLQTGITTIGNTVIGLVVDGKGRPVPGARVSLFPPGYNPASIRDSGGSGDSGRFAWTDQAGGYAFDGVPEGAYNVEAEAEAGIMLIRDVRVGRGWWPVLRAVLEPPGALTVDLSQCPVQREDVLYLPGTSRFARLDSLALQAHLVVIDRVAPGTYRELRHQPADSDSTRDLLADSVVVWPRKTTRIQGSVKGARNCAPRTLESQSPNSP